MPRGSVRRGSYREERSRRPKPLKLVENEKLRDEVERRLSMRWMVRLPAELRRTLTWDQGEMAEDAKSSVATNIRVS